MRLRTKGKTYFTFSVILNTEIKENYLTFDFKYMASSVEDSKEKENHKGTLNEK